jgi:hypothetical protein
MSGHLQAEQIDACLLGEGTREAEQHLHDCAVCQGEVNRLREAFSSFRDSVHQLASSPNAGWTPLRSWTPVSRFSLAVIAFAVCLVVVFLLPWHSSRQSATQAAADAALLTRIDAEVSRTVPSPMEPLTEFLSNDISTTNVKTRLQTKE